MSLDSRCFDNNGPSLRQNSARPFIAYIGVSLAELKLAFLLENLGRPLAELRHSLFCPKAAPHPLHSWAIQPLPAPTAGPHQRSSSLFDSSEARKTCRLPPLPCTLRPLLHGGSLMVLERTRSPGRGPSAPGVPANLTQYRRIAARPAEDPFPSQSHPSPATLQDRVMGDGQKVWRGFY